MEKLLRENEADRPSIYEVASDPFFTNKWFSISYKLFKVNMHPRNIYTGDPVIEYFPDYSVINFFGHLAGAKPLYKYVFNQSEG